MTKQDIVQKLISIYEGIEGNVIDEAHADYPEVVNLKIYDEPIVGFGAADDALFEKFKEKGVVGPWAASPEEWLPGAKTVISFFMPYTKEIRESNRLMTECGSHKWAYGRVEGQAVLMSVAKQLAAWLEEQGMKTCIPAGDPRFFSVVRGKKGTGNSAGNKDAGLYEGADEKTFSSNWSERHAAFVCGLGTFGMSRGLITAKGMAGRFGSIIITGDFEPDVRPYTDVYEYCIRCGACAVRCPANAFPEGGGVKDQCLCSAHVGTTRRILDPRYGCGLCQTKTPCESGIPKRKKA